MEACFSKTNHIHMAFQMRGTNHIASEKPIINAEVVHFLRASRDNKVWLRNQNHMGRGDDAHRGSSNNKRLAAVNMAECEAHMSYVLSQSNLFKNDFCRKIQLYLILSCLFKWCVCCCKYLLWFYFFSVIFNDTFYVLPRCTNKREVSNMSKIVLILLSSL